MSKCLQSELNKRIISFATPLDFFVSLENPRFMRAYMSNKLKAIMQNDKSRRELAYALAKAGSSNAATKDEATVVAPDGTHYKVTIVGRQSN